MVNANRTYWDTKLHATLSAYRPAYKVTTKHFPFSLVFGTKSLLPMAYLHLDVYQKWSQEIHPILEKKMEQLMTMDLTRWEVEENMTHMQLLQKERQDNPCVKTKCKLCDHRITKPPRKRQRNIILWKKKLCKLWKKSKILRTIKNWTKHPHTRHHFSGQQILWHLCHKIHGPNKFKIRWAWPDLIKDIYNNGSVDVTTLQGEEFGRVNMNKLKPY